MDVVNFMLFYCVQKFYNIAQKFHTILTVAKYCLLLNFKNIYLTL